MTTPLKWEPNGRLVRCLKFEPLFNPSLIPLFLIFFFCLLHKKTKKEKEETVMAKRKASSYEEIRLKRLEENKKRLEALNLPKLAQALRNSSPSKPSSVKPITTAFFLPHKNEKLKKKIPLSLYYNIKKNSLSFFFVFFSNISGRSKARRNLVLLKNRWSLSGGPVVSPTSPPPFTRKWVPNLFPLLRFSVLIKRHRQW